MAISGGDGSIILTTKVDETGLKKGMASIKSMGSKFAQLAAVFAKVSIAAAAATATVAITKMATSAYADYEQLVGGVETLFKGSAQKVIDYANDAFYTAGMSANQYMETVTGFSASLLQSLGGDTEKAADYANRAIIDMSDNANKMGTSMEMIQYAYQGFAKQNYTMLDNLKLGYGGTKTEMERLVKEASQMEEIQKKLGITVDANSMSFGNVVNAISVVQEKMGIAGATAAEAEKTITGSANMMKAAWQNVLSAIAGGGDLDRAINNLVYSIQKYFENIVPVVERSLQGIGQLIERVAPMLVQTVARSLIKAIPSLLNAVYQMIIGLAKGTYQGIIDLFKGGAGKVLEAQTNEIAQSVENQNALTDAVEETNKALEGSTASFDEVNTLTKNSAQNQELSSQIGGVGGNNVDTSALTESENQVGGFASVMQEQFAKIVEIAKTIWDSTPVQTFVEASKTTLATLWDFTTTMWNDIKDNSLMTWQNIEGNLQKTGKNLVKLWTSVWKDFNNAVKTWGKPIIKSISELFNSIWSTAIDPYIKIITKAWADFTGILLDLWNEHGATLLNNVGEYVHTLIGMFQSIYDNILEPIITPFLEQVSWLWDKHLKDMIYALGDFIMSLVNGVLEIYNKFIAPLVEYLLKKLAPAWSFLSNLVVGVFGTIFGAISDVTTGILEIFTGLIDFITGVFTGNWEKAWEGVKSIFKGIFDALVGIAKAPINLIIDAINSLISGLNKVKFSLPGWDVLGDWAGKTFGINIPKIPKLAQGAVIPPNREFLAVLGDQKHGTNIETPESLLREIYAEGNAETNALLQQLIQVMQKGMTVNVDGKQLMRINREAETRVGRQTVTGGFANAY